MTESFNRGVLVLALSFAACTGDSLSVGSGGAGETDDGSSSDDGSGGGPSTGDASGSEASGAYLFTRFDVRTCDCSDVCEGGVQSGDGLWIAQDDGALEVRLVDGGGILDTLVLNGGIDADGTVDFGGVTPLYDGGDLVGQTTNEVTGTLEPRGRGSFEWRLRIEAALSSGSVDCDAVLDVGVAWWDPSTVGPCNVDADCHPERPFCSDGACSAGSTGTSCSFPSDCTSDICVEGTCRTGAAGEPCVFNSDCQSRSCLDDVCASPADCEVSGCPGAQICFDGSCQDGVEGDPCDTSTDCGDDMACVGEVCFDGSEGDPCDTPIDCNDDAPICSVDRCQDGSAGDPCQDDIDCDLLQALSCGDNELCA